MIDDISKLHLLPAADVVRYAEVCLAAPRSPAAEVVIGSLPIGRDMRSFVWPRSIAAADQSSSKADRAPSISSIEMDAGSYVLPQEWLSAQAQRTLGPGGVNRFETFRKVAKGRGQMHVMSASTGSLDAFLSNIPGFPVEPSLFLDDEGTLILEWENSAGAPVEIQFPSDAWLMLVGDTELRAPIGQQSMSALVPHIS